MEPDTKYDRYRSCPTHCCPIHGCKYGLPGCPVAIKDVAPRYVFNNGCERCEADRFEADRLREEGVIEDFQGHDAIASVVWAFDNYTSASRLDTQAHYLIELSNAIGDLATWHPGYDLDTGQIKHDDDSD